MNKNQFSKLTVGTIVRRHKPGDYVHNRIGEVIAIDYEAERVRVKWNVKADLSNNRNYMRTWVTFSELIKFENKEVEHVN